MKLGFTITGTPGSKFYVIFENAFAKVYLHAEFDVNTIPVFRVNVHATDGSELSDSHKSNRKKIIEFCRELRSLSEMAKHCGFNNNRNFSECYLKPLIGTKIQMTIPDKTTSRLQKYIVIGN